MDEGLWLRKRINTSWGLRAYRDKINPLQANKLGGGAIRFLEGILWAQTTRQNQTKDRPVVKNPTGSSVALVHFTLTP